MIGRSGVSASGSTASVGAIRRPVSAPWASGAIASARDFLELGVGIAAPATRRAAASKRGRERPGRVAKRAAGEEAAEPVARADALAEIDDEVEIAGVRAQRVGLLAEAGPRPAAAKAALSSASAAVPPPDAPPISLN